MKKNFLVACVAACVSVLFVACSNNSSNNASQEETLESKYTNKKAVESCTIANYHETLGFGVELSGMVLLDKEEKEILRDDSIFFDKAHNCFIGKNNQGTSLYFPKSGAKFFVLQNYTLSSDGSILLAEKNNEEYERSLWGAYSTTTAEAPAIVKNDNEKIVFDENSKGFYIPYENGSWLKLNANGEGVAQMTTSQMKKLKGFDPKAEVQVLK